MRSLVWPFPPFPNPLDRPGRAPTHPDPEPAPWVSGPVSHSPGT